MTKDELERSKTLLEHWNMLSGETRVMKICMHSYKTPSFEKEQSIAYIFIFKPFPTLHFIFF